MKQDDVYFIWNKTDRPEYLSNYFQTIEFSCKCKSENCVEQKISKELIDKLTVLRQAVKSPMRIHSGFRCKEHNEKVGGVKNSQHVLGNAADVSTSAHTPYTLLPIAESIFDAIGIAQNFLHLDTRKDKKRRWKY